MFSICKNLIVKNYKYCKLISTTKSSGSITSRNLSMRESHRKFFSHCLSKERLRRAVSLSTRDSKRMANYSVQATLDSAPDVQL